jgi:hypothetical protein
MVAARAVAWLLLCCADGLVAHHRGITPRSPPDQRARLGDRQCYRLWRQAEQQGGGGAPEDDRCPRQQLEQPGYYSTPPLSAFLAAQLGSTRRLLGQLDPLCDRPVEDSALEPDGPVHLRYTARFQP